MIEAYVRPFYQRFFMDPVAKLIGRLEFITPNRVTTTSVVLGMLAAVFFIFHARYFAVVLLLLSGICDSLDGTLARLYGDTTDKGAAWDIVGDRIVEFSVMLALFLYNPTRHALPVFFMLGASYLCITSFLVVGIFSDNNSQKSFYYSVGLMERPEAFAFFVVMMLVPSSVVWIAWIYSALVFYTAAVRMIEFLKH